MSREALLAAVDELVALVEKHNEPDGRVHHVDAKNFKQISWLDARVKALAEWAGISIPTCPASRDYRPFGATQIPHRQTSGGQVFVATKHWRQMMMTLRASIAPVPPSVNYPKPDGDPPPRSLIDNAAREVPVIFADSTRRVDGKKSLIAIELVRTMRKRGHTLDAAEWAVYMLVSGGMLTAEKISASILRAGKTPRSVASLYGGAKIEDYYEEAELVLRGTEGFKLCPTRKLSEWWEKLERESHSIDATANASDFKDSASSSEVSPAKRTTSGAEDGARWITVSEAETLSGINRGVISRAAGAGEIATNGEKGRSRRLDSADFNRWHLARARRPEQSESDATIRRRLNDAED